MKNNYNKKKNYKKKTIQEPVLQDSEAIRLASLKKQKKAFKAKEQVIRDALNSVDNNTQNNKIVFDDETIDTYINTQNVIETKKKQLFDDDDGDDGADSGAGIEFNISKKEKVVTIGNDDRFKLNKQFLDDNEEHEVDQHENDDNDFANEKSKEMEILQKLLGKPISKKTSVDNKVNGVFRYDPMAPNHQDYEPKIEKKVKPISKKQKKAEEAKKKVEEEAALAVPVSNEVFFSVSDKLSDALKGKEEFSLLSSFGAVETENNNDKQTTNFIGEKMEYELPSSNRFKYDSTDDEDENFNKAENDDGKINNISGFEKLNDSFFFTTKDTRFKDAENFFKSAAVLKESFSHVRRELKQIVRKKIRNNAKKLEPRKKKIQTMKKKH
ncbi:hypothetical protein HCN44_011376 [Aphidius gifuensis]|uniref:Uncharacterized protein n=1 Tax=Aphidius gifuensis TaxID=684658 RepID=A0A834XWY1_APHGI|nr:probable RNA-binding protein CG14230 [Aphidius gifuensis]KAF7994107.1 hypothetical protein HCN44_011376 [Aphidius gifuensis]